MRVEKMLLKPGGISSSRLSPEKTGNGSFCAVLQEALKKVNNDQQEAERAVASFVAGDYDNLHQLLIKTERAQLSLQLAVQVTSKAIAAYQEISRMQI